MTEETTDTLITDTLGLLEKAAKQVDKLGALVKKVVAAERRVYSLEQVSQVLNLTALLKSEVTALVDSIATAVERERFREEFVPLPDGAALELGYAAGTKTWKHDRIKTVLIESILERHTDDTTGTLNAPVSQLMREALDAAGISYWKTTSLDHYDIDAKDYVTQKPRKFKHKVHRND